MYVHVHIHVSYYYYNYSLVQVIQSLIWCCISMESCVPLMTIRYLQLRGSLYTAVCQCYYTEKYPLEAEVNIVT